VSQSDTMDNLLNRVLGYIQTRDFQAVKACELAPGVIAVADSLHEVDVYFDTSKWEFTYPQLWERQPGDTSPGSCTNPSSGIGLLQGIGRVPAVRTLDNALPFAQRNLRNVNQVSWHTKPEPLSV
jgi:hypothetical protein